MKLSLVTVDVDIYDASVSQKYEQMYQRCGTTDDGTGVHSVAGVYAIYGGDIDGLEFKP